MKNEDLTPKYKEYMKKRMSPLMYSMAMKDTHVENRDYAVVVVTKKQLYSDRMKHIYEKDKEPLFGDRVVVFQCLEPVRKSTDEEL